MDSYEYRAKIKICKSIVRPYRSTCLSGGAGQSIAAASTVVAKELHEEVGKNRTMHEFARGIHVMSDSANLAGA